MNPIKKFRVWDRINNKMIYSTKEIGILLDGSLVDIGDNPMQGEILNPKSFELLQYAGIKDKNGKEIYEGDIIENGLFEDTLIVTVSFLGLQEQTYNDLNGNTYFQVVGNIYENKETK